MQKIGRYRVIECLGQGGQAEIFLARTEGEGGFSRPVALKRQRATPTQQASLRRAMIAEARVNALLDHPNIASVFDIFEDAGQIVLVMEYLHGVSLRQLASALLERGSCLSVPLALQIVEEVLCGLDHAHQARDERGCPIALIHRDISPENVFVCASGVVKLTDFGIARSLIAPRDTRIGMIRGKARYLSPEQARGETLTAGTDIFAVGLLLHELLSGVPAIHGEDERELMQRVNELRIDSILDYRSDVHERVLTILELSLAARPEQRYPSARAMAKDVRTVLSWLEPSLGRSELRDLVRELFAPKLDASWQRIWQDQSTQVADVVCAAPEAPTPIAMPTDTEPSTKRQAQRKNAPRKSVDLESLRRAINEAYDPEEN